MAPDLPTDAPLLGEPLPVEFMNTIWADRSGVYDELATAAKVTRWLRSAGPFPGTDDARLGNWLEAASDGELEQLGTDLRKLRNGLRRLAAAQTADPRERAASDMTAIDEAVATLNAAAGAAPQWSQLNWGSGTQPERATVLDASPQTAIAGVIAEEGIHFFASDRRHGLRACMAPGCVLYFVKHHTRREWCSTACGNRARAARHYRRQRTDDTSHADRTATRSPTD